MKFTQLTQHPGESDLQFIRRKILSAKDEPNSSLSCNYAFYDNQKYLMLYCNNKKNTRLVALFENAHELKTAIAGL